MSRIFNYSIGLEDLDFMGIVGNHQWMVFLLRARIQLLEDIGFPYSRFIEENFGAVVARAEVDYLRPASYRETIQILIKIESIGEKEIILSYLITNQDEKPNLKAILKMVTVDKRGKSILIPESLKSRLREEM